MEKDFAGVLKGCWILIISIHSLAWRKTTDYSSLLKKVTISIHSLAWRKTNCICIYIFRLEFQSTLSHGERHAIPPKIVQNNYYFNPLSRMEKDQMMYEVVSYNFNFNPLSRMEKDTIRDYNLYRESISIHSLAWRKTTLSFVSTFPPLISIHSLAWRKTNISRPLIKNINISIHSLAYKMSRPNAQKILY